MRSIKFGLGLMVALVFSIATTAWASAASFLSNKAGELLLSEKVATQTFVTSDGTVECSEAKVEAGESSTTEAASLLAEIHYGSCLAFGFVPTEISNADYLFLANGTVHIDKLIKIVSAVCEVSVPVQSTTTTKYDNVGNNIELLPAVTGIHYTASKCPSNGSFTNGTYKGNAEVMTASGALCFMLGEAACGPPCPKVTVAPQEAAFTIAAGENKKEVFTYTNAEMVGGADWTPKTHGENLKETPVGGAKFITTDKCRNKTWNPQATCPVEIEIQTAKAGTYEEIFSIECGPSVKMKVVGK